MRDRGSGQNTGGGILHAIGIQTIQIIPPIHFRAPPLFFVVLKNLLSVCLYFVYFPPGVLLLCTFHSLDVLRRVATDVTIYVPWPHPNFVCNILIRNLLITSCLLCSKAVNIAADYIILVWIIANFHFVHWNAHCTANMQLLQSIFLPFWHLFFFNEFNNTHN